MDLGLTDEQQAFRATVRRCLAEHAPISGPVRAVLDGADWSPDAAWARLVELGTTGILVPVELGGLGLDLLTATVVAEELGRGLHPGPWIETAVAAPVALLAARSAAADELLADLAAGRRIAALVTPPPAAAGPGLAGSLRAEPDVDVDGLTGAMPLVRSATHADLLLVLAGGAHDTDDDADLWLYALDADAAGVAITPVPSIDRTTALATVTLDAAPARRLGRLDPGALRTIHDAILITLGADALGAALAISETAVQYAKDRHQFGVPIGSFQAVQHLCVDMLETVELNRGTVLQAAWSADAGSPAEAHRGALGVKADAERLATVADTAIQVLGGIGFTWEHDAHLWFKRLLTWSTTWGSSSPYRVELGRSLVASGVLR